MHRFPIKIVLAGSMLILITTLVNCDEGGSRRELQFPRETSSVTVFPSASRITLPPSTVIPMETQSSILRGLVYADSTGVRVTVDNASRSLIDWSSANVNAAIALSPDGTSMVYSHTAKDLWFLDLISGESTSIISPSIRMEHAYILRAQWSPKGDFLALLVGAFHVDGRPAIELNTLFTVEIRTGRIVQLESGVSDFAWLSSGRQIAYNKLAETGEDGLYLIQVDGQGRKSLPVFTMERIAASPREDLLAVSQELESLYVVKPDGSVDDLLRDYRGPADLIMINNPSWSPDGTRIAFFSCEPLASNPQVCDSALFVINVETRVVEELAASVRPPLAWSPDGQFMAVTQGRSICQVSLEGEVVKWFDVSQLHNWPFEWR